jgi:UPF0755 protein
MVFSRKHKILISLFVGFSLLLFTFAVYFYQVFFNPNALVKQTDTRILMIPPNTSFTQVVDLLAEQKYINDKLTFAFVAKVLNYQEKVRAGRYRIRPNMGNMELVRMLRAGMQEPIRMSFNNVRLKKDLAGKICRYFLIDSLDFAKNLSDPAKVAALGFDTTTVMCMFLPNTYEMYWTSSEEEVLKRMKHEYEKFWTTDRQTKAKALNLSPIQVSILASIVEAETSKKEECATVAGVYLNRLRQGEKLQADPTVIFGIGDFSIKRVLLSHLEFDSPYNTYKYAGLPPGPINLPAPSTIDAVLNYQKHDYLFFCAKEDFSGYHTFAVTYSEHLVNAKKYQEALSRLLKSKQE